MEGTRASRGGGRLCRQSRLTRNGLRARRDRLKQFSNPAPLPSGDVACPRRFDSPQYQFILFVALHSLAALIENDRELRGVSVGVGQAKNGTKMSLEDG